MAKAVEQVDARILIAEHLKEYGTMQNWLSEKTGISNTHLHFILKCERDLTEDNRKKINEALGTNF